MMHSKTVFSLCLLTLLWIRIPLTARASGSADYLLIEVTGSAADVRIHAKYGSESLAFELKGQKKEILDRFKRVYSILEDNKSKSLMTLRADIDFLSTKMLLPLAPLLSKTNHVVYYIDKNFVRAALDLLEVKGKPIFLSHAVTYVASKFELPKKSFPKIQNAYLMADLTCDPELGLQTVAKTLPKAQYLKMEAGSLSSIKKGVKDTSVLVISAHGSLDGKNSGEIAINNEELDADFIKHLNVDLTYFDSCQMGAAWDFIEEFVEHQSSSFYVAPIISNDAGDSSTKTVTWFFTALKNGEPPAQALAQTRRQLYKFYQSKKLDEVTVLNKAFPFRVYEFDQK